MGKLNIAHHKSYHPYRADNIERVRRDEEEARLKEAIEDGRVSLADSEARISLLRERAKAESKPSKHKQQREEEKLLQGGNPLIASSSSSSEHVVLKEKGEGGALTLTSASGHINFFEELEHSHQNTLEHSGRAKTKAEIDKAKEKELERGVPLMPDEKDRRPWYMDKGLKHPKDMTDEEVQLKERTEPETEREKWGKRSRGNKTSSKTNLDPSKDMKSHLAARSRALSTRTSNPMPPPAPPRTSNPSGPKDAVAERTTREAAERARAEALIAKRRAEMDATSSVGGDTPYSVRDGGYSDVFNKKETREAHHAWEQRRGRHSDRRWDEDRDHRDRRDRSESSRSESRGSYRDEYGEREKYRGRDFDRDRERGRDRDKDRGRDRDLSRGERNRTRGVDDVRHRS
ncbi:N-terminal domain of CBF1 interacting co-repressor CIR [Rhizoctonia solani]|uniref:N-terminal domain of CBF1 interacting co-repressor CIR n=1 Tax=Rhizoctonia solani TaxID=456999 RepID=A0A8H7LHP8_9AGAM|nr:N-terminal domain of CBF1 interacting co-repressor CIR [Rhizoctonia solani]